MAEYNIWLSDPYGVRLALIDQFQALTYTRVRNAGGALALYLPATFDRRLLRLDGRIEVWRSVEPGREYLDTDTVWLIRNPRGRRTTTETGKEQLVVSAVGAAEILRRRIVAYAAGTTYSTKTAVTENLMKAIVRENFNSLATDTARSIATYMTVEADGSFGVSQTKHMSRKNVLEALQEISQKSLTDGTAIYFDVVALINNNQSSLEFRTFVGQRGADRRYPSSTTPVLLSVNNRNLEGPSRNDDYSEEVNYVFAGGQGEQAERAIATASDSIRIALSPLNLREGFTNAVNVSTSAALSGEADAALREGRPVRSFSGKMVNTADTEYGKHWRWGDQLTVEYDGETFDAHIHAVQVTLSEGRETVTPELRMA